MKYATGFSRKAREIVSSEDFIEYRAGQRGNIPTREWRRGLVVDRSNGAEREREREREEGALGVGINERRRPKDGCGRLLFH